MNARPLIAHVLYRLDTGGMERVALSVINATADHYRHAVICLAGYGSLQDEIQDPTVPCLSLDKRPGKDWACHFRLWRALRQLQPDLVQTYNIGALDAACVARLAGVGHVVHAEHGRDNGDPQGQNRKYRLLRRLTQCCIARFVAVSGDLEVWLRDDIGIRPEKIVRIPNGIDQARFTPEPGARQRRLLGTFAPPDARLIVNVGRLDAVKDQATLILALRTLCDAWPVPGARLRLAIIGEGAERHHLEQQVARLGLRDQVRLLGNRDDIPALLAECDVFVLSSVAEGIPLTILEAMAMELPVVATNVGGVAEAVVDGTTGTLVPPSDPDALADALHGYVTNDVLRREHGRAGSRRIRACFGLEAMVRAYITLYDGILYGPRTRHAPHPAATLTRPKEH